MVDKWQKSVWGRSAKAVAARRPCRPGLEVLEGRCVPATVVFSNGRLLVDLSGDSRGLRLSLRSNNGGIVANGGIELRDQNGRTIRAGDVRAIVVRGSRFDDELDLSEVTTRWFAGLNGKIEIYGNGGRDFVAGSRFDDRIWGGDENDRINGNDGNDQIWGDAGNDALNGQAGNDTLWGGSGNDTLNGGRGDDRFYGGPAKDRFLGELGYDVVFDYRPGEDERPGRDVERF